jgi:hypothetical protein
MVLAKRAGALKLSTFRGAVMNRVLASAFVTGLAAVSLGTACAQAQYVTFYQPTTSFFTPAPAVAPATWTVAPTSWTPTSWTVARPVTTWTVASPVVVPQVPVVAPAPVPVVAVAPAPTVTFFRAPGIAYVRSPQIVTRHRPILGGTVSRVRSGFTPVVY